MKARKRVIIIVSLIGGLIGFVATIGWFNLRATPTSAEASSLQPNLFAKLRSQEPISLLLAKSPQKLTDEQLLPYINSLERLVKSREFYDLINSPETSSEQKKELMSWGQAWSRLKAEWLSRRLRSVKLSLQEGDYNAKKDSI